MTANMFWDTATSTIVLMLIGLVLLAAFVVAHTPKIIERFWPQAYAYAKAAALVQVIAAALLFFLLGFRISDEREETKRLKLELAWNENQLEQQKATAEDAERLKAEADAAAQEAKGKLDDYRKQYGDRPEAVCAFTADDLGRLRALRRPK